VSIIERIDLGYPGNPTCGLVSNFSDDETKH